MDLANVLCLGGVLHGQLHPVLNVHCMRSNYVIDGHNYILEYVPTGKYTMYYLRDAKIKPKQCLDALFTASTHQLRTYTKRDMAGAYIGHRPQEGGYVILVDEIITARKVVDIVFKTHKEAINFIDSIGD